MGRVDFFSGCSEGNRFAVKEVIGKGSYGIVCSAIDRKTGQKVAIKKIEDVFQHRSDAMRILREIKLLRFLRRHPDIVEIKHILLPASPRDFKDLYVVFELMESDFHQVIRSNDDLSEDHFRFFLYQMLRALKFIHSANIFHRDLKPKNILANSDCKLKICDFGLARVTLNGASSAMFWTDYVATRWYRAPELCGSFYTKYTTAIDIWSIGCIFAEVLTRQPLFPGKNVAHQLDLITDLLGTPSPDVIARIRNEKARKYLSAMRKKPPAQFQHKFPNVHPQAVRLLRRLLAFDAADRPTAEEALADPYFKNLARIDREPSCQPAPKEEFDFEKKHLTKDDIRSLIYQEILEYHPQVLSSPSSRISSFPIPSAVERLRQQFDLAQRQVKGPAEVVPSGGRASLSRDHDQQCIQPNWNAGNRPLLGPHKVVPGDSLKVNMVSGSFTHTVGSEKHEQSNVKRLMKNASFGLFQKVGSQQSQLKAQHRPEQAIRKESNYERAPVIRSQVKAQHRQDQANRKESNNEKAPVASRSRSMGSTVARLVAAFSGQSIYS